MGQTSVRTKTTAGGIAALADTSSMACSSASGAVSLASLVQIAENCKGDADKSTAEEPSGKDEKAPKEKKAKGKDKKPKKEEPKTLQEKKDHTRNFVFKYPIFLYSL